MKMRGYGRSKPNHTIVAVMFSVITLLLVYIANIAPVGRAALLFTASFFIYGILVERMYLSAFLSFVIVCFTGFVIVPDKAGMLPYLLFFGHYGIFRYFVTNGVRGGAAIVLKLLYYNAGMALIHFFGGGWLIANIPWNMPWWLLVLLAEGVFAVYELLFTRLADWYMGKGRARLLGRVW
jgi:hypothetical protein